MSPAKRHRACPLCRADEPRLLYTKGDYEYKLCGACRLTYVADVPADNIHFDEDFFANQAVATLKSNPARSRRMGRCVRELERAFPGRRDLRILDLGCGKGWNLLYLKEAGYTAARGVDVNARALETARSKGLAVDEGLLHDQKYPDNSFDALISDQVIEHLEDPRPFLAEAFRILKPGGIFWASVPNVDAWHIRLFLKQRHRHFVGDAHLNLFNPRTFRRLYESVGFRAKKIETHFEELTLPHLKGVLFHPEDFDLPKVTERRAERQAGKSTAPATPSLAKQLVKTISFPVDAMLASTTRWLKAGAYLEITATK